MPVTNSTNNIRAGLQGLERWLTRYNKAFVYSFFTLHFICGLIVFADYGLNWDDATQRYIGQVSYNYVVNNDKALLTFIDNHYGVALELPLIFIENWLNLTDTRDIYLMRHLSVFVVFWLSCIFFYRLAKLHFGHWLWALLATVFLVLSPRIFGDAFHNGKDIPFLGVFTIAVYTLNRFLDTKTFTAAAWHALACAVLLNLRLMGIILPVFTLFFLLLDIIGKPGAQVRLGKAALLYLFYLALTAGLLVLMWPYLWENPAGHFIAAFEKMRDRGWAELEVIYRGKIILATQLPWHYIPTWIAITTPKLYVSSFIGGFLLIAFRFLKNPVAAFKIKQNHRDWILIAWLFGPVVAVIANNSSLYDGWRHVFFVYPPFVLLAVTGLKWLWEQVQKIKAGVAYSLFSFAFILMVALEIFSVTRFMVRFHPHQNVYFNKLTGQSLASMREHYDMDYWGVSYKQGLEYVLRTDTAAVIKVRAPFSPGVHNQYILPEADRNRLLYVPEGKPFDYFISSYRARIHDYTEYRKVHAIEVNGADILGIYKSK